MYKTALLLHIESLAQNNVHSSMVEKPRGRGSVILFRGILFPSLLPAELSSVGCISRLKVPAPHKGEPLPDPLLVTESGRAKC